MPDPVRQDCLLATGKATRICRRLAKQLELSCPRSSPPSPRTQRGRNDLVHCRNKKVGMQCHICY